MLRMQRFFDDLFKMICFIREAETVLADLEKNELSVKGFRISCTRDDALDILENMDVRYCHNQDVKLTRFDNEIQKASLPCDLRFRFPVYICRGKKQYEKDERNAGTDPDSRYCRM